MTETRTESVPGVVGQVRTFPIADVRGYTRFTVEHGDEAAAKLAARFAAIARRIVAAHEGEVVELRGDEALAVFSSARQALRAALGLQEAFAQETMVDPGTSFKVGIGLDAGEAVPVEGGYRGTALNLAARLCSLAGPGEVLASDGVIHLARKLDGLEYAERGAVELKGFDDPVRVVEVQPASWQDQTAGLLLTAVGERATRELPIGGYLGSLPASPVVGRAAEMAHVSELIDAVLKGTGHLVLLVGEPGAGKTRLAQEVALNLRNRGFLIAAGRCYEPHQSVPFYPFVEALTALYLDAPSEIQREVPKRWADLARLLPALGLPVADYAGSADQQRLFWSVTGFVQALARTAPVALLLDDLHWADAVSLELLQHLARHTDGDRVLLLGTYRDVDVNRQHPLEAALRDLRREGLLERLEVRRLDREETGVLIAAVMGQEQISDEFTDLIYRRTEGNAFFVQQVLHAMVERGDLFRKDGRWDRKAIEEIEVPESVRSVVGQRLSRLAEETQETLREASVLGPAFGFNDLQAMTGRSEAALESSLDEAMAAGMVRETGRDEYGFDHALTQGSLYAELSSRRRRRLHVSAGQAIEALPAERAAARAAELAWHFLEGDDPVRALRWSTVAGDGAERVYAHSDAENHYRTALQLAIEEGNRVQEMEAREKLAATLALMARYQEALEIYETAVDSYREQGDFEGEIRVMAGVGWILFQRVRRDEGIELLEPVLERWQRAPIVSAAAASLHVALGNLYWHAGRLEEALRLLEQAVELAGAVGNDRLLGRAEGRRGVILTQLGRAEEGLDACTRAIALLEAAGDLQALSTTLHNRSFGYAGLGQMAGAWTDLERALEASRRLGNPAQIAWILGVMAQTQWSREGDWTRTRPYVEELMRLERYVRGTRSSMFIAHATWLRLVAGNEASALQDLERLAGEAEQDGDVALWQFAQLHLANWDLLKDRPEEALARYEAVLDHPGIESQFRTAVERKLAHTYVACGQLERADMLIARSDESGASMEWFVWQECMTTRARLRAAQGQWEEARAAFEEALAFARERNMSLGLAETGHAYGEALANRGETDAARQQFEEALRIFRHMKALPYSERTERALAELQ